MQRRMAHARGTGEGGAVAGEMGLGQSESCSWPRLALTMHPVNIMYMSTVVDRSGLS
jgi:hypothetical protein